MISATHLRLSASTELTIGDCARALTCIGCEVDCGFDEYLVAELFCNYEATSVMVRLTSTPIHPRVVEWKRTSGDTLASVFTYVRFARTLQGMFPDGAVVDEYDPHPSWLQDYHFETPVDLIINLRAGAGRDNPIISIMNTNMDSPWSLSILDGCRMVACVSRRPGNASILMERGFVQRLMHHLASPSRHTVRCCAAAIGNIANGDVSEPPSSSSIAVMTACVAPLSAALARNLCNRTNEECRRAIENASRVVDTHRRA